MGLWVSSGLMWAIWVLSLTVFRSNSVLFFFAADVQQSNSGSCLCSAILLHVYSNCCSLTLAFCLRFTLPLAILPGHRPGMPGSPDRCVLSELAIVKVEGHSSPVQSSPRNPLQSTGPVNKDVLYIMC